MLAFVSSIFILFSVLSSPVPAFAYSCTKLFCLTDASNTTGNQTIQACAGTPAPVNYFNFWYNGTGPLNLTTGGIASANYTNGSTFSVSHTLTSSVPCVNFVLNGTAAPFTNATLQINATVYNLANYTNASLSCAGGLGCNGSMLTINYVSIETRNVNNIDLPSAVFMTFNNTTKTFTSSGPGLTDNATGYWAEHCVGVNVSGYCVNATPYTQPNTCMYHGTGFPDNYGECDINSSITIHAFDFISSNFTQQNLSIGTPLGLSLSTPMAMSMIMVFDWNPDSMQEQMHGISASNAGIYDYDTDALVYTLGATGGGGDGEGGGGSDNPPAFLTPNEIYRLNFTYSGSVYSFPFMTPTSGMTGLQVFLVNSSANINYRTVIGKVVNTSGNSVKDAVVYAQFYKGPGGAFGITLFNSSVTNENGVFSMKVPRTRTPGENPQGGDMYFPMYQFYIVSNQTNSSNSVPLYFSTTDSNSNKGYFVIGDNVVLPTLILKSGGQVSANVTLNSSRMIMSELSKFLTLGSGLSQDAVSGKFSMTSMFDNVNPPTNAYLTMLSPVGSPIVDFYGKNMSMGDPMRGSIIGVCFNNSFSVSNGVDTQITCSLQSPGYINLTVFTCTDVFDISQSDSSKCTDLSNEGNRNRRAGSFDFWFNTNGILRDSSGNVISFLSPEGTLLQSILGMGSSSTSNLTLPVPAGTYTFELVSPFDYGDYLNSYNGTSFTVSPGNTTNVYTTRGEMWDMNWIFNPSFVLSGTNSINLSIKRKGAATYLNTSHVSLNGSRILLLNRSDAAPGKTISFGFDSSKQIFYNNTFSPGTDFGLNAGKYLLLLNATNASGSNTHTAKFLIPIHAYDFQVGLDTGGFTFGSGQNISAKLFVYNTSANPPVGLNASAANVTITIYDPSGLNKTVAYTASAISNGQGAANITAPTDLGFYEIVATVRTDGCRVVGCGNNTVGVADTWMQISNINIKTSTDRHGYQPTDNVILTVQVSNATSGTAISGASIEVTVDTVSTPATGTTDSSGKATITLNPSTFGTNSRWSFNWHNLRIKISKQVGSDVMKLDTWYGFDVRGLDLFMRPDRPVYQATDNVTINIYGPIGDFSIPSSGVKVDGTTLTQGPLNDCAPTVGSTFCVSDAWGAGSKYVGLGNWSIGHHDVVITISQSGSEQKFYTGFDVNDKIITVSADRFSYNLYDTINLTVKLGYINGTAVNNANVNASLYKAQPPNDILVTSNYSSTTPAGVANMTLNASQPGFNYMKVNVSGQLQFIGVQVSSVKVTLLSAAPSSGGVGANNYNVTPGGTVTIYINASSAGVNIADSSTVKAALWAFGNRVDLPSNTTTSGNATITVQMPSFAPSQMYGLEVTVTTPNGEQGFAAPSMLTVTGGTALQMSTSADRSFMNPYKPGDVALLTTSLRYQDGTGASGYNITFEVGSEGTKPQTAGTVITDTGGSATKTFNISSNHTDGPYYLHAYITNSTDIQAYSGFLVSSIRVDVTANQSVYAPGETMNLTITVFNRTSGTQINATSGFVNIFNKNKGEITTNFNPTTQSQPYSVAVTIPNDANAVGTYPVGVIIFRNQSQGLGFTMVDVRNSSESLNLTLPSAITAGTSFVANISSSSNGTASLIAFSPAAKSLIYENTSVYLNGSGPYTANVTVTISNPGLYVFNLFFGGIGTTTQIIVVTSTTGTTPAVWAGTSTSANATSFTTSQDVYILSNTANSTAQVLTYDTSTNTTLSYSLPLTLTSGSRYYGVLNSTNLVSGRSYFVRLDTSSTTGLVTSMFVVS